MALWAYWTMDRAHSAVCRLCRQPTADRTVHTDILTRPTASYM